MRNLCGYIPLCYHQLGEQNEIVLWPALQRGVRKRRREQAGGEGGGGGVGGERKGRRGESIREICTKCT